MYEKNHMGLTITKGKIGASSLDFLRDFTHLESLSVYNYSKGIKVISNLTNLKEVALCGISIKDVDFLASLPNLEYLWFQGTRLKSYESFCKLKQLKAINFFLSRTIEDIDFLSEMTSLQYIGFTDCSKISSFPDLTDLDKLRRVYLDNVNRLEDITGLSKAPNIESIIICGAKNLKADSLRCLYDHPTLKAVLPGINLEGIISTDEIPEGFPRHLIMNNYYGTDNENFELYWCCLKWGAQQSDSWRGATKSVAPLIMGVG